MASFTEHISQAEKNLSFLQSINDSIPDCWDWQVTVAFYIGVHLINAHIASKTNQHYRTHQEVDQHINPFNVPSVCKLPDEYFTSYKKLQGLSRRSRYLCSQDYEVREERAFLTYDKHFAKSIKHLDKVLTFMNNTYPDQINFYKINIKCIDLKKNSLVNFKVV